MRQIAATKDEKVARTFAAYLVTEDIATQVDADGDAFDIWVREEDQFEQAREAYEHYVANPQDARYQGVIEKAETIKRMERQRALASRKNVVQMRDSWARNSNLGPRPLTIFLIILCVVVAVFSNFNFNTRNQQGDLTFGGVTSALLMTDPGRINQLRESVRTGEISGEQGLEIRRSLAFRLQDILNGQIWRAMTPAFVHYGFGHLIMNMWSLWVLGSPIERRYGTFWFGMFVVLIGIPANLSGGIAPEAWGGSVLGAGFSGVLFGLFGLMWMRSIYEPASGFFVPPSMVMMIAAFLLIGLSDIDERLFNASLDNWGHGIGLIVGMLIGVWPTLLKKLRGA